MQGKNICANKIIITGPESSGKTTLTESLARHYGSVSVPEYAREYLQASGGPYDQQDLLRIADEQLKRQERARRQRSTPIFCDTGMLVLNVWHEVVFGESHPKLVQMLYSDQVYAYLLCRPDIPWQPDPLRENPNDRDQLYERYWSHLQRLSVAYCSIGGQEPQQRLRTALQFIEKLDH